MIVRLAVGVAVVVAAVGCSGDPDVEAAREFDRHPLYWVGVEFEGLEFEHVESDYGEFVTLVYGTCDTGDDGGCAPPLQLQIQFICTHLAEVTRSPIWRRRQVRGAPVGTIDGAPVLLSARVQVKVYRGQGSEPGLELRALEALRSANDVAPVISEDDPIPPAPGPVLEGERVCR
jgi:hypothetical protein